MDPRTVAVGRALDFAKRTLENMSMQGLDKMKVVVSKTTVLEALKKNRDLHKTIVKEAREGYVIQARKALEKELKKLEAGKPVRIGIHLELPSDNTKVYDTAIQMLEMHEGESVELDAAQFRVLVMNKWDWMDQFLFANRGYSQTAASMMPGDEEN